MSTKDDSIGDIKETCPNCYTDLDPEWNYCNQCATKVDGLDEFWENDTLEAFKVYTAKLTSERIGEWLEDREPEFDPDRKSDRLIREQKQDLIDSAHDEKDEHQTLAQFLLATIGEDWRELEPKEEVECEACNETYYNTHTQEHHISYLHDITITVCYSCHHRIHHEDGYCDELQPDTTKEEAKKIRETGFDPDANQ